MEGLQPENTEPEFSPKPEAPEAAELAPGESRAERMILGEIEDLALPLIQKMKGKIDEGAYDLLVSDEGSGRLPTMLFREIYQARNPKKEFDTLFVSGARTHHDPCGPAITNLFSETGRERALVITDYAESAQTLRNFLKNLKAAKISEVSAAALRTAWDENDPRSEKRGRIGNEFADFFEGEVKPVVPLVAFSKDESRAMAGVEKIRPDLDLLRTARKHPKKLKDFDVQKVARTRKEIKAIAGRILERVWGTSEDATQTGQLSLDTGPEVLSEA